jgi:hypothetical protein
MPKKERKPKELLADQELIGFARRSDSDDQAVQRAGSAKVFSKPRLRQELEMEVPSRPPRRDGH